MRHHILLPTDFSDNAASAANYALKLYQNQPCTFYLLHTWSFSNTTNRTYITTTYIETQKEEAQNRLIELKDKIQTQSTNKDHEFKTIFSTDSLIDAIETAIKAHDVNLVIMGTKGATGAKEFLFGSNTVNILSKMRHCPLMVIPEAYEYTKPEQMAFPTDFNRFYGEELNFILQLSKLNDSRLRVFHINTQESLSEKQNYNFSMLKAYLEDCKHSFHWMPDLGSKEEAIKSFIEEFDIQILTMINYKHSFIENLIKEPVVRKLGHHTRVPFLVIPSFS